MKYYHLYVFFFLLSGFGVLTNADTLMSVYALAQQNDREFKASQARYSASRETATIQGSTLLPQLTGSVSYGYSDKDDAGTNAGNTYTKTESYQLSLQQALLDYQALYQKHRGKVDVSKAEVQLAADQQTLILRTANAYFNILSAQDQLETSEAEEKALATQLRQTRQRYEVGLIPISDVHETQAAFDSAVANTLSARVSLATRHEELSTITSKIHDNISPLKKDFLATAPEPNNKEQWIDAALENNLSIKLQQFDVDGAQLDSKATRAQRLPRMGLSLNYAKADNDISGIVDGDEDSDTLSTSLDLTVPIYTGGRLSAQSRQAAQLYNVAKEELQLAQRNIIQNTRTLFLSINTSIAEIKARQQAIISNQSALDATQAGYEAGTRDIVDLVNGQRNLYQARRDYLTALYTYILQSLELKQAAGTLNDQDLRALDQSLLHKQQG